MNKEEIDLKLIFKLLKEKGFYYGESITNSRDSDLWLDFSTGRNGRGESVEIRLGEADNDIEYWFSYGSVARANISNEELIEFIKKDIKKFGD